MTRKTRPERKSRIVRAYLTEQAYQRAINMSTYLGIDISSMIRKLLLQPGFLFLDAAAFIEVLGGIAAQFSRMLSLSEQILDESANRNIEENSLQPVRQLLAGYEILVVNFEQLTRTALNRLDDKHQAANSICEL